VVVVALDCLALVAMVSQGLVAVFVLLSLVAIQMLAAVVGQEGLLGALVLLTTLTVVVVLISQAAVTGLVGCTEEALVIVMLRQFQNQTEVVEQSA
jgi:hypothetical protein